MEWPDSEGSQKFLHLEGIAPCNSLIGVGLPECRSHRVPTTVALFLPSQSSQQKHMAKQAATFRLDGQLVSWPFEWQEVPSKSGQDKAPKLPEAPGQCCG